MNAPAACPRCGTGEVLATLRLPYTWRNASGHPVRGTSEIVLCARCGAADPLTGPIVAYFARHGTAGAGDLTSLARALRRWAAGASPPRPDPGAVAAEAEAWRRGDL
ncbi:DUF6300 family protein [Bailinhaonella thermotolerans]|uniref:Uncharacterized protein n=1 Tax=Bailinhaonella thermotolerans TaxID=1070861 RepID=A0A3A4BJN4_9ACTN|nr:DUF6300 family protein [Bailinhaonella thermotolerans]RJL35474.1 hypothetical protein D5H75_01285 [Bailinhaonella thermotolerans]